MKTRLLLPIVSLAALLLPEQETTGATVRDELTAVYGKWSKARTGFDKETIDKMLAPEFFVQLGSKRITRTEFIDQISEPAKGASLTRFDSRILTLTHERDAWIAVITEKLEYQGHDSAGQPAHAYSLWVTKDTFRKNYGAWLVLSSEALGWENWGGGKVPPFEDWKS